MTESQCEQKKCMIEGMHYGNVEESYSGERNFDFYNKWEMNYYAQTAGVATFNAKQDVW